MRSLSLGGVLSAPRGVGRAKFEYAVLIAVSFVLLAPALASADSGGAVIAPPSKQKAKPQPAVAKAQVSDVRCKANPGGTCIDVHRVQRGGTIALMGRGLTGAKQVMFFGARGAADNVTGLVQTATAKQAIATVPPAAVSGPVAVVDGAGKQSKGWAGLLVDTSPAFSFRPAASLPSVQVGLSQPRTIFFGGLQRAIFSFQVTGTRPVDVQVQLVRLLDGVVVQTWQRPGSAPGVAQRIVWNGSVRGKPQAQGRYAFRVTTPGALGARAQSSPDDRDAVTLMGYVFPIRGPHTFGMGAGRFGAARRGHVHQGQDTFAKCGTPLVAARGGKVLYAGYHSLAGYYVVIDGSGTGIDYMYAHLRQPALVATGDTVYTGQQIGEVGDTGDAVGCHLHFEEWTAPGWYKGGHPFDPLPDLKRWDASISAAQQ